MEYQAIPANCGLIEWAREDCSMGALLCHVPWWYRSGKGPARGTWAEGEALWRRLCELAEAFPGIETWNFELHREWDELHYLLSAMRRGEKETDEAVLFDKAVRGTMIAESVRATQGRTINYVSPSDVASIAALMEPMTVDSLRDHYIPEKMEYRCVYKFWADRAEVFERSAASYFDGFRAFYLNAASRGNAVLVCLD